MSARRQELRRSTGGRSRSRSAGAVLQRFLGLDARLETAREQVVVKEPDSFRGLFYARLIRSATWRDNLAKQAIGCMGWSFEMREMVCC